LVRSASHSRLYSSIFLTSFPASSCGAVGGDEDARATKSKGSPGAVRATTESLPMDGRSDWDATTRGEGPTRRLRVRPEGRRQEVKGGPRWRAWRGRRPPAAWGRGPSLAVRRGAGRGGRARVTASLRRKGALFGGGRCAEYGGLDGPAVAGSGFVLPAEYTQLVKPPHGTPMGPQTPHFHFPGACHEDALLPGYCAAAAGGGEAASRCSNQNGRNIVEFAGISQIPTPRRNFQQEIFVAGKIPGGSGR